MAFISFAFTQEEFLSGKKTVTRRHWEHSYTENGKALSQRTIINKDALMNVKEIIKNYLKDNCYDGLFNEDDCGCSIIDLAPCDEIGLSCEPGYVAECDCNRGCAFHITNNKLDKKINCIRYHSALFGMGYNGCPYCHLELKKDLSDLE